MLYYTLLTSGLLTTQNMCLAGVTLGTPPVHPFLLLETRAEKAPGVSQFRFSLNHGVIQS